MPYGTPPPEFGRSFEQRRREFDAEFDAFDQKFDRRFATMQKLAGVWIAVCAVLALAVVAFVIWGGYTLIQHFTN